LNRLCTLLDITDLLLIMINITTPIKLCRRGSCCPELSMTASGNIRLTDDYGGKVVLTQDEVELLYVEITKLIAQKENI